MADDTKTGQDWTDDELIVIVADYFVMLAEEIVHRPFVKSRHNAAVVDATGRSRGSVEFKYQNISAVLEEMGLPWIQGYKPRHNFQTALFDAIDLYLSGRRELLNLEVHETVAVRQSDIFVDVPDLRQPRERRPKELDRLIRKFDPVERDFRNRTLGSAGEEFVLGVERTKLLAIERPDLAERVQWVSRDVGDGAGFDILSFDREGSERHIEVKTTNGAARTPFFLTRNEIATAQAREGTWYLYRVHLFAQSPRIFTLRPPLEKKLHLDPETWRASL